MSIREILASKGNRGSALHFPDSSVVEAINIMTQRNIGSLVVKQGEQMVGLLTDRHIVRALSKAGGNLSQSLVRDAMETKPILGRLDDDVDSVRRHLTENHISHLPVVDDSGAVVGIISSTTWRAPCSVMSNSKTSSSRNISRIGRKKSKAGPFLISFVVS